MRSQALARGGYAVVVDLDANLLYFAKGRRVLWSAPVGTGTGLRLESDRNAWDFHTPNGAFHVTHKAREPDWVAPDWYFLEHDLPVPGPNDPKRRFTRGLGAAAVYIGHVHERREHQRGQVPPAVAPCLAFAAGCRCHPVSGRKEQMNPAWTVGAERTRPPRVRQSAGCQGPVNFRLVSGRATRRPVPAGWGRRWPSPATGPATPTRRTRRPTSAPAG